MPPNVKQLLPHLVFLLVSVAPAIPAGADTANTSVTKQAAALSRALAAIETEVESQRKTLHIPGASLAIVKDGRIIYMKGLGLRDVKHKLPVTPDTLFAIGSSTKAFTAMTVMIDVDAGKVKLTDSPKKYLPYFSLQDPEADKKITLEDLLCHRSGLTRTDLAMMSGKLTSEELIRVVGYARPTAKLREKFQYQNIMYLAAGQIVSKVENVPWTDVVMRRLLIPLGMHATDTSLQAMEKTPDHALGYNYDPDKQQTIFLPMRDLRAIAPAGAINSNARDMTQWLQFLLSRGSYGGKRLVSEASFREITRERIKIAGKIGYGLGWFLREWNGHKVMEHGGNIDGFNAEVALMPDQKLGFVLLTNVTASSLGTVAMETIWQNLVGGPKTPAQTSPAIDLAGPKSDPAQEVGKYATVQGFTFEVALTNEKLTLTVPGQPTYTLENTGGRRYKLNIPGFFITFRASKATPGVTEVYMEQPQGNFVATKVKPIDAHANESYQGPLKELLGTYADEKGSVTIQVAALEDGVRMVVPGQPPYAFVKKSKDMYAFQGLPESFSATIQRDSTGKVTGMVLKQPQGNLDLIRAEPLQSMLSGDELMQKEIEALGGEANLRRHNSSRITMEANLVNQGITAQETVKSMSPGAQVNEVTYLALGKPIMTARQYVDGARGGIEVTGQSEVLLEGAALKKAQRAADFYPELDWKTLYKSVTIKGKSKVGSEEAYRVEIVTVDGDTITEYVSTKTFLLRKRELSKVIAGSITLPTTELLEDYRLVDGVQIPFLITEEDGQFGQVIHKVREAVFDIPFEKDTFAPHPVK